MSPPMLAAGDDFAENIAVEALQGRIILVGQGDQVDNPRHGARALHRRRHAGREL